MPHSANPLSDSRLGPLSDKDVEDLKQARRWRAGQDRRAFGNWDKSGSRHLRVVTFKIPVAWLEEIRGMIETGVVESRRAGGSHLLGARKRIIKYRTVQQTAVIMTRKITEIALDVLKIFYDTFREGPGAKLNKDSFEGIEDATEIDIGAAFQYLREKGWIHAPYLGELRITPSGIEKIECGES